MRQFLGFSAQQHGQWKHPAQLGTSDVEAFLNDLVVRRRLSDVMNKPSIAVTSPLDRLAGG